MVQRSCSDSIARRPAYHGHGRELTDRQNPNEVQRLKSASLSRKLIHRINHSTFMRAIYAALALPLLFRLLRARRGPTREQLLPPNEERVVLLGASSGVGKELALAYAARGAKM